MENIVKRLLEPPSAIVSELPVETKLQELPYDKLTWENFEKLCLRLAQKEASIESCRQYGIKGNPQEGIDIYAKKEATEKYIVYQCKKVKDFGPQKIRDAISVFLAGNWIDRTEKFVLCTQESLNTKIREDESFVQRELLSKRKIILKIWDSHELNTELKKYPDLVNDFFSWQFVKVFNGEEALDRLIKPIPEKRKYNSPTEYIPRRVIDSSETELSSFFEQGKKLKEVLKEENRVALLGWAGTGKSIELQKLACDLSSENSPYFPFLIHLNLHTEKAIEDYIPEISSIPQNAIVICLDGLDEVQVGSFDSVSRKIKEFGNTYPEAKIVVSCRSNFYTTVLENENLNTLTGFKSFVLAKLSSNDVNKYLKEKLQLNMNSFLESVHEKKLDSLLYVPFYLIKLSEQYLSSYQISNTKAELFDEIITENIKKDVARYFPDKRDIVEKEMRRLLEKLAFILEYQGKNNCLWEEVHNIFNEKEITILKSAGSNLDGNEGLKSVWKFNHNNIQEYLSATILSKQKFKKIKGIIAFRPAYKKVKPTWVNTLSFLVSILDTKDILRDKLISWLIDIEPELLIKFEPDKLNQEIRHKILTNIFSFYKKKNRIINRVQFNTWNLAKFSMSEVTLNYLKVELQISQPVSSRSNALELVSYFPVETKFPSQQKEVKQLIEQSVFEQYASLPYLSIKAYVEVFDLDPIDFKKIIDVHGDSKNTWVRYAIFSAIHKQNYQDQYIAYVLAEIKKLILDENSINDRLSNENTELINCIKNVKSVAAVNKVIDFISDNFEEIRHSSYFEEIIQHILNIITESFPENDVLFEKVSTIFNSEKISIHGNKITQFINYFEKTKNRTRAFKKLVEAKSGHLDIFVLNKLAVLANNESINWFADEFKKSKIERETIENFQFCLNRHNGDLKLFNQLVNEKERIPLPVYRDYDKETLEINYNNKELLFNKEEFIKAIEQVFIDAGKDQLTYDEIWEIQKTEYQGKYLPVIYETTRIYHNSEVRCRSKLIEWLNANWDSYSIGKIIEFMKNNSSIEFDEKQIDHLINWCSRESLKVDFKCALTSPDYNSTRANVDAVKLSFLIRKLNLIDYPKELYLDMLSFQRWDDTEVDIFDFVEKVVPKDQMVKRVLKNLSAGIKYPMVLGPHLSYCIKHNLKQASLSLIPYLSNSNHERYKVLDTYLALNGDLHELEDLLIKTIDDFKYKIIDEFIKRENSFITRYLDEAFDSEQEDQAKLNIAKYLIKLQKVKGVKYYINFIKKNKIVPDNSFPANPLFTLNKTRFLKYIFNLYELGFNEEIKYDKFNNLKDIASASLQNIALNDDNFHSAKRLFHLYKLRFNILTFLKLHKLPEEIILNLDFYFENMEQQYYVNRSLNISLSEALDNYAHIA